MKGLLIGLLALGSLSALADSEIASGLCRPGFSSGSLNSVKKATIDSKISEIRGAGLIYLLQIEIAKESDPARRTADSTIAISASKEASGTSLQLMEDIENKLRGGRVNALCVRVDPNSYRRDIVLPQAFDFKFKEDLVFELDVNRPFPL